MDDFKVLPAGDTALVVEFGEGIDQQTNRRVLALAQCLREADIEGVSETVPTFRSLMVYFDPLVVPAASLTERISELIQEPQPVEQTARHWHLPICYDSDFAPDLEEAAARLDLTPSQLAERHSNMTYHVYMLGFLPGQAYLGDLSPDLVLPRRKMPRQKIPAGSVAIAMSMTCIFPMETPCGWHLLGHSPVSLFRPWPVPRALLTPGDKVRFMPVSRREHDELLARNDNVAPQFDRAAQGVAL